MDLSRLEQFLKDNPATTTTQGGVPEGNAVTGMVGETSVLNWHGVFGPSVGEFRFVSATYDFVEMLAGVSQQLDEGLEHHDRIELIDEESPVTQPQSTLGKLVAEKPSYLVRIQYMGGEFHCIIQNTLNRPPQDIPYRATGNTILEAIHDLVRQLPEQYHQ